MPNEQIYKGLWIRWIHSTWEKDGEWRSDISPNILKDSSLSEAQFIYDDHSCVFIPFKELRRVLSQKTMNKNGMIIFNVNPTRRTIDEVKVELTIVESGTKKKRERAKYKDIFKDWNPN